MGLEVRKSSRLLLGFTPALLPGYSLLLFLLPVYSLVCCSIPSPWRTTTRGCWSAGVGPDAMNLTTTLTSISTAPGCAATSATSGTMVIVQGFLWPRQKPTSRLAPAGGARAARDEEGERGDPVGRLRHVLAVTADCAGSRCFSTRTLSLLKFCAQHKRQLRKTPYISKGNSRHTITANSYASPASPSSRAGARC